MKKLLAMLLALCMVFALCACGQSYSCGFLVVWVFCEFCVVCAACVFCVVAAVSAAYMPVAGINIEAAVVLTARKTAVILLKNLFIYYLHQI